MSSNSILLQISITPLHVACENGHTETAQMLIDRGADVKKEDSVCYIVEPVVVVWLHASSTCNLQPLESNLYRQGKFHSMLHVRMATLRLPSC